jgi:ectoine hydroxylase-related dioxygenase (phytanoyl-CoA dioxygenase family)
MYTATNTPEWHIQYLMRGEELENLLCSKICFSKLWLYMFFKNTDNSTFFCLRYSLFLLLILSLISSSSKDTKHVTGTLKAGDAILYDTHLLHCASENVSQDKRRTLLTLSAQEENKDNKKEKSNIKKKYRKKLQLKDINNWQTDE